MFGFLRKNTDTQDKGVQLFGVALARAKSQFPAAFIDLAPADDEPLRLQRIEAISLAMSVMLWRLKKDSDISDIAQAAHDSMFLSFDRSLRESGVGDMGVSHRVKKYAQGFYGRLESYTIALDKNDIELLSSAIKRNIGTDDYSSEGIAVETLSWAQKLNATGFEDLLKIGKITQ